jgi:glutaredoxin
MASSGLILYWQHGCTSCLRVREFLAEHGIAYESINVMDTQGARDRLTSLGARSIPVLVRDRDWIHGQDLDELARFLGVSLTRDTLRREDLVERVQALLGKAAEFTRLIPHDMLDIPLPGRPDRSAADLAWHVAMIANGFLAAVLGGELTFDYFERRPVGDERRVEHLVARQHRTHDEFKDWWSTHRGALPARIATYYGTQTLDSVLERTTWHMAQHCRQLEWLLGTAGIRPDVPLSDRELGGLPLPAGIWDREIGAPG